ncbi:MAG TPA: sulfite oxidase [Solirubrobacteraceae bacterium]|nr:sulfite oxidase [Solirubrobacteraceae bacterium]
MRDEHLIDEDAYFAVREEQLVRRLERAGHMRRGNLSRGAAGAMLLAGAAQPAAATRARATTPSNAIVKPLPPEWFIDYGSNAEMRWDSVSGLGYFTPNERFFVRDHTATPRIDARTWTLRLWGDGLRGAPTQANPVKLGYEALRRLPSVEIPALIECAGNGRSLFAGQQGTPATGTPWGLGAVGAARWRGVPLAEVLERAGIMPGAVDVMPWGLDADYVTGGVDYGPVRRPLPVAKALGDAILAYEMNGEPLPPDNGFPVRLVVPGWAGVASVKWVGQLQVSRQPLYSYWNTASYILEGPGYPTRVPLTAQALKSVFELASGATLPNHRQPLTGRSWSGAAPIKLVEVSSDGGVSWCPARLLPPNVPHAWVRWEYPWSPPGPGRYTLQARATDCQGCTQPATVPFNTHGYLFSAVVKHAVTVVG